MNTISTMHATATFDIRAAMERPEMRAITRLLASAEIEVTTQMSIRELDKKLAGTNLSVPERIQIKNAMTRAGLLK